MKYIIAPWFDGNPATRKRLERVSWLDKDGGWVSCSMPYLELCGISREVTDG